ncbi:MAG: phosphoenolpyruvate--protein phosphotransferase [Thermanaerothrix sp.]|uniref:phosphoenolpyruvate--protein phosphotransferase n=1 Tax=Thermanaerothrix sp. TaxID=2972675 RepID=UPI003C79C05C
MVSLVLVSHSKALAESLEGLIRQMAGETLKIGVAAGAGPDHNEFGTDATDIARAITEVDSPDGILVLMDLGSAILSAEMALELIPPEVRQRVRFCPGPLVEGGIAAGVQASLGSDIETVCQEAHRALQPKAEQLEGGPEAIPPAETITPTQEGQDYQQVEVVLKNAHGLHARPAARFVQLASKFDAEILVTNLTNQKGPVSAKSLNALATLGALRDHRIRIMARGKQATEALEALRRLVEERFGEPAGVLAEPKAISMPPKVPEGEAVAQEGHGILVGLPVSDGVAVAPLYHYESLPPVIPTEDAADPEAEWKRLQEAIGKVRHAIQMRHKEMLARVGAEEAAIFEAHALLLDDPDLLQPARRLIFDQRYNAARAWKSSVEAVVAQYQRLEDPYLRQRALDVQDVGNQVLRALSGEIHEKVIFEHPVILVADELTPTETAQLDLEHIQGIVTLSGGPTSHSAILARSLGIPAVTGLSPTIKRLRQNTLLGLDGFQGRVWVEPAEEVQRELETKRKRWLEERQKLQETSLQPAMTRDGLRIEVVANAGNLADAQLAAKNGAEGVGLLRTEFLFLTRQTPPSEEEQFQAIRDIGLALKGKPVIVRTLDVGGDKPLPYIPMEPEANPFLGVRALRLSLQQPDLFRTQLRAILRAGAITPLRIMFPMVASLEEVEQAREFLAQVHNELAQEGIAHAWPIDTGIMVEIPSAAIKADALAPVVDFFSIGTNDLTQYTLAAERGNPRLAYLADALHPAVLRLIEEVVQAAHAAGKWVGVCGELAGEPEAVPILVGLGVDELSINPAGIPKVKALIRAMASSDAQVLSKKALACAKAAEVRKLSTEFLNTLQG